MVRRVILPALVVCTLLNADILSHKFELWGCPKPQQQQHNVVCAADVYKMASPSVVLIEVYDDGKVSGSGSGFIVSADGAILTNYHVIAHTKHATVRLANGDAYDDVSVLDIDKRKDIALIEIKAVDLPPLKLGHSSTVQVGDTLYALGNLLGIFQNTLSEGILSAIRQGDGYKYFQLSTPISHGSSGSPVFDTQGQVVGIIEALLEEGQNLNFAIPIDYAAGMLGSLAPRSLESIYEPPEPGQPSASVGAAPGAAAAQPTEALKSDALDYLVQKIGVWAEGDAEKEFGQAYTRRDGVLNGAMVSDVYKYKSPTAGFSDVELSFDRQSGKLVAAYLYPQSLVAWQTIRGKLGSHYMKRKVHMYIYQMGQHQTVLVDSGGNVVSFGVW